LPVYDFPFTFEQNFFLLSGIKKLAGQTVWYGLSNIGGRFLSYLTVPIVTYLVGTRSGMADVGTYNELYACIAFLNIVFTYGFETGFFRFSNKPGVDGQGLFQTAFTSHIISTVLLSLMLYVCRKPLDSFLGLGGHDNYILYTIIIIAFDTLSTIPLAKLRKEERPKKYAFVNIAGIFVYVFLNIIFLGVLPGIHSGFIHDWYERQTILDLLLKANIAQSLVTFLLLFKEWKTIRFRLDKQLWLQLWYYSSPLIIAGLAGMTNEVMDRVMLKKLLPMSAQDAEIQVAIYANCYKLSIFITLLWSAFRMAAEPFFFNKSQDKDSRIVFARVMKWFVITLAVAFLFTTLFLDELKYIIGPKYRGGLGIVAVLCAANICIGIYYNLSIWYKLADKMRIGMYITLIGAFITLIGNYFFIPKFGYYASAWATFYCYFAMMLVCYFLGQRIYPIPYNVKKITAYLLVMLLLYFINAGVAHITENMIVRFLAGGILMITFLLLIAWAEKKELQSMPVIGKYIKKYMAS